MRKLNLLGVGVGTSGYGEACEAVRVAAVARRPLTVTALSVHGVMAGALDRRQRDRLNALDLVVPEGRPVRWGLNLLFGAGLRDAVCGCGLMLRLCAMCARQGLSVAFYGGDPAVLDRLCATLHDLQPGLQVAAAIPSRSGRLDRAGQAALAREIGDSGADLVFVGLGGTRQDVWLFEHRALLRVPAVAVGGAFAVHAERAMPGLGRRRRTLLLGPLYLALLGLQKLRLWRFEGGGEPAAVPFEGHA